LGRIAKTHGQVAAFDAVMFLAILLVASVLILGVSTYLKQADDVSEFEELYAMATRTSNALMRSTVPNASYMDIEGNVITSRDISVLDMIVEELLLMKAGVPESSFEGDGRYNHRILQTLSSLVDEGRYRFELQGGYMDIKGGQTEKASKMMVISLPDVAQSIIITLSIWPC
jgi:hypothetical protein